jgi:hypothetical protein
LSGPRRADPALIARAHNLSSHLGMSISPFRFLGFALELRELSVRLGKRRRRRSRVN